MAIDPGNFKQIQDVLAKQKGTSDSAVTGAAHTMQNNLQHKKKKHHSKHSNASMKAAIAARMQKNSKGGK